MDIEIRVFHWIGGWEWGGDDSVESSSWRQSGLLKGSVRSRARGIALPDKIEIVHVDVMMSSAIRAPLAKRARREAAETIWL